MADIDVSVNATAPRKVTTDGVSGEQHSIADQINADQYEKSKDAVTSANRFGLRISKLRPPGSI